MFEGKRILLVVSGGIAAYKALDLIRRLRERGASLRVVMTEAATAFVTPLSIGAVAGEDPFLDLWDRAREHDIGHIRLAREADLVVVAPATADLIARMANGLASDLASTVLLATTTPILLAPAMNPTMWQHAATQRNVATLAERGVRFVGPEEGEMAEAGEAGLGRMSEPATILAAAEALLGGADGGPLAGRRVLVTAGPTREHLDPIRFLTNRSSGRQGYAIAAAAAGAGAEVTLVSGPTSLAPPSGVKLVPVETAQAMLAAVEAALPADVAVMAAAIGDWHAAEFSEEKLKKSGDGEVTLRLVPNPDILAAVAKRTSGRPQLVVGFAAETERVVDNARAKLAAKGCDWIIANDVSAVGGAMGGDLNQVTLIAAEGAEPWPNMTKAEVAERLVARIAATLGGAPG